MEVCIRRGTAHIPQQNTIIPTISPSVGGASEAQRQLKLCGLRAADPSLNPIPEFLKMKVRCKHNKRDVRIKLQKTLERDHDFEKTPALSTTREKLA